MSHDSASDDDVASLFKRLGTRAGTPHYHDFSAEPASIASAAVTVRPAATPPAVPPAVPAVAPAALPPVHAVPTPLAVASAAVTAAATAVPLQAGHMTSLQRLFQRLAQAPLQGQDQSPLARLRQR